MDPISLLIYLVVFAVVIYLVYFVIDRMALPDPIRWIVLLVVGVILLLFLLGMLTGHVNAPKMGWGR